MNLSTYRGDTLAFGLAFKDLDQDLDSAYFTVKAGYDDTIPVVQKSLDAGIEKVGEIGEEVKYRVRVAPEDTEDLTPGLYVYDLQIGVNGDVFTIMSGQLEIKADVTRTEE